MGRPIIQLPEDAFRVQEVIFRLKPDIIIETGVAHGGSLIFYATLCKALGKGRVVGIDIEIRAPNRQAIEAHPLAEFISLIEGSSTSPTVVSKVKSLASARADSSTARFLSFEGACVERTRGLSFGRFERLAYIVATDGIMQDLSDLQRGQTDWTWNNPVSAAREFVKGHPEFIIEQPEWLSSTRVRFPKA